jgi:hypothetical protein
MNQYLQINGRYFEPTKHIAWIIGNTEYGNVRIGTGNQAWRDIAAAKSDVASMTVLLKEELGFETTRTLDARREDMDSQFEKIKKQIKLDYHDEQVLVYMYYSGHGVMATLTKMVCNEADSMLRYWDLEAKLSELSMLPNAYVIGVFDCCRESLTTAEAVQNESPVQGEECA